MRPTVLASPRHQASSTLDDFLVKHSSHTLIALNTDPEYLRSTRAVDDVPAVPH